MKKIFIAGATSAIAQHTARLYAARGDTFFLVARNADKLTAVAEDLRARGAQRVETQVADLTDSKNHLDLWKRATESLAGIDLVLIAHGVLPDQKACQADASSVLASYQVNLLSVISLLTIIANDFERRKSGCIAVISSVAGDRGRQSNYIYGSAKAGLSAFLQGLRNRLHAAGVPVITIKPGFVKTPMTAHLPTTLLFASPEQVARGIYKAIEKKKDVVYLPGYWRAIMAIITSVPEAIFKRTKL